MSVYAPNTDLRLVKSPLTLGDGHQLDFASAAAQTTYFTQTLTGRAFNDFTYQRKDNVIRIPDLAENLYQYNYCTYTNFAGKRIYAFITKIEFINQNCTHVYIKTDVFQTWLFDFTARRCMIRREHVADDGYFKHTLPENLPTGEIIANSSDPLSLPSGVQVLANSETVFATNYYCCAVMTEKLPDVAQPTYSLYAGGTATPCIFYAIPYSGYYKLVNKINDAGLSSAVVAMIAVPKNAATFTTLNTSDVDLTGIGCLTQSNGWSVTISKQLTTIDGYTPKNKKLFTAPYAYFRMRAGSSFQNFKYELFTSSGIYQQNYDEMKFSCFYMLSVNPELGIIPLNYKGTHFTGDKSLTYNDFPQMAWNTDVFANYFALHKWSIMADTALTLGNILGASSNGDTKGIIGNVTRSVEAAASYADMSNIPDGIHGNMSGQWLSTVGQNDIYCECMSVRKEYAKAIDDYFSIYGYRVDRLDVPQWNSRPVWNYIELENPDISGEAPQDDLDELKEMFSKGLTVWHSPSTFGDYSQNNAPV